MQYDTLRSRAVMTVHIGGWQGAKDRAGGHSIPQRTGVAPAGPAPERTQELPAYERVKKSRKWLKRLKSGPQRRPRGGLVPASEMDSRLRGNECVREDALSAGCKSPPQAVTACEVESNCVAAMRGGEQLEAKGQPVAKRTRFGGTAWRACSFKAKPGTSRTR